VIKTFKVETSSGTPVRYINELEVVGDLIYGNVLPLNVIIEIDKKTGTLTNVYDFKELYNI
jgi:glutamine cyclotransferase